MSCACCHIYFSVMVVGVLVDDKLACSPLAARPNKAHTALTDSLGRKFVASCTAEAPHAMLRIFELTPRNTDTPLTVPHTLTPRLLFPPLFFVFADGSKLTVPHLHDMWKTALATAIPALKRIERTQPAKVLLPLFRLHLQPGTLAVTAQKLNKRDGSVGEGSVRGGARRGAHAGGGAASGQLAEACGAAAAGPKRGGRASSSKRTHKHAATDDEDSDGHKEEDDDRDDAASMDEEDEDEADGGRDGGDEDGVDEDDGEDEQDDGNDEDEDENEDEDDRDEDGEPTDLDENEDEEDERSHARHDVDEDDHTFDETQVKETKHANQRTRASTPASAHPSGHNMHYRGSKRRKQAAVKA